MIIDYYLFPLHSINPLTWQRCESYLLRFDDSYIFKSSFQESVVVILKKQDRLLLKELEKVLSMSENEKQQAVHLYLFCFNRIESECIL